MEDDENKYVILEYCPEGDLFSNITDRGRYVRNDALAKSVFLQIIDAVMHCHSLEIYHRDLKPENILVTEGGSCVKLADFGLATTDRITSDYGCGSTFYMSPGMLQLMYSSENILTFVKSECQQSSPRPYASYASAPNDVWSLGVILVNLTCGRNPWKRACSDDSTYSAYLKDRSFLKTILPITDELNHILSMIFDPDPSTRITLPVLRQVISECLKFTMSPQSPVSVMPSTSTPPSQYDQIMPPTDQFPCKQPNQLPPSPPYTPPHTPPLTTTSVPSWTVHNTAPSISDYQSGCTELGTVFSNAASRSPILQQSTFAIVQPIPTKVTAYPPTQYVLPSGYQYWFPQHISRMAGYFHQPFQQHLQYMAPVPVC
jgi:serine/threonine protein kinase